MLPKRRCASPTSSAAHPNRSTAYSISEKPSCTRASPMPSMPLRRSATPDTTRHFGESGRAGRCDRDEYKNHSFRILLVFLVYIK